MPLPKIATPTYELELPSTGKTVQYRPFLVKEEKLLVIALESEDTKQITTAIKAVIKACIKTRGVKVEALPTFDIEYLFLNIRGKSVGENLDVNIICPDDKETFVPTEIDLTKVEVEMDKEHSNKIELTDDIGMVMNYPTFQFMNFKPDQTEVNQMFDIINSSIHQVYEGKTVYEKSDFNKKELKTFVESLTSEQFMKVQHFFETMPRLRHQIEVENPKTKVQNTITLDGLQAFFEYPFHTIVYKIM